MRRFDDKVVVITGASSGIGRALAVNLAARGATLALSDIDVEGLAETHCRTKEIGGTVRTDILDVADRAAVFKYAAAVAGWFGVINVVINNAGITFVGDIEAIEFDDLERVMNVDYWGVVNGTKAFLPYLIESGEGHIVNMSSVSGLMAAPGLSAYNSAKFAVRGFTESLRIDVLIKGHPVGVTCVHPGGVRTRLVHNSSAAHGYDRAAMARLYDKYLAPTSPDTAARRIVGAIRRRRPRVLIGMDAHCLDLIVRLTGTSYQRAYAYGGRRVLPKLTTTSVSAPPIEPSICGVPHEHNS